MTQVTPQDPWSLCFATYPDSLNAQGKTGRDLKKTKGGERKEKNEKEEGKEGELFT